MPAGARAQALIDTLQLARHPEGGWYREIFRSADQRPTPDGQGWRSVLTSIDFLLCAGQASAWHRVAADEAWHLLEGGPLRLWLMPPELDRVLALDLGTVQADAGGNPDALGSAHGPARAPRQVVPAHWWQSAEPLDGAEFAYVGATVGPGFDFADFSFGRDDPALRAALQRLRPDLARLL
jgi:predicted cupin superfamily sugar epimerase